eukprot:1153036-Pelagomonas_calceolata.AAC.2
MNHSNHGPGLARQQASGTLALVARTSEDGCISKKLVTQPAHKQQLAGCKQGHSHTRTAQPSPPCEYTCAVMRVMREVGLHPTDADLRTHSLLHFLKHSGSSRAVCVATAARSPLSLQATLSWGSLAPSKNHHRANVRERDSV